MIKKCAILLYLWAVGISLFAQSDTTISEHTSSKDTDIYIPMDLQDCFRQLDSILADTTLNAIRVMEEDELLARTHFGLGMWMRNNWGLWAESRFWEYFHKQGLVHPDDISALILIAYHRHLNDKPLKIRSFIQKTKRYWKKQHHSTKVKNRKTQQICSKRQKILQKWDIQIAHNWEESCRLLGLPVKDTITGCCVKERNIGDTIGPEEWDYIQRNKADSVVKPYNNNINLISELESFNSWYDDVLPHKGHVRKVVGKGLTMKDVPFRFNVSYNIAGQIIDKWLLTASTSWKEIHQYDSLGRQSRVELYRNDTLKTRYCYSYNLDTYLWTIEERTSNNSDNHLDSSSFICTMDKAGRVIQTVTSDLDTTKATYDLKLTQYDQLGRETNRLFYNNGKLVFYSFDIHDDQRGISYFLNNHDMEYDQACWISLLNQYGDEYYFGYLDNIIEELCDTDYWEHFHYDSHGNMTRNTYREDGHRRLNMRCRIRYW